MKNLIYVYLLGFSTGALTASLVVGIVAPYTVAAVALAIMVVTFILEPGGEAS